jgi:hypothetical protein
VFPHGIAQDLPNFFFFQTTAVTRCRDAWPFEIIKGFGFVLPN